MSYRSDRMQREADERFAQGIADQWRRTCLGASAGLQVQTASGPTDVLPTVTDVYGPDRFVVRIPAGMIADDLRENAHRLAAGMGAAMLRVTPTRHPLTVQVTLLAEDPLTRVRVAVPSPLASVHHPLVVGQSEDGVPVTVELPKVAHLITQGASGSGKSVGCYNLLGQLVAAPDVVVAGSDITGLLLGPWQNHPRHAGWQACGTADLAAHVDVLERVVAEMDARIHTLPFGHDQVVISRDCPLILCVLEEWPGALRVLGQVKAGKGETSLVDRARTAVSRLLAEGRKAGVRVLIVAQRADASVVGGFERGQASHTISFRVDTMSALLMLHADVAQDDARRHATAAAGIALLSAPGVPLLRLRSPFTTYAEYCRLIAAAGGTEAPEAARAVA